MQIVIDIDNQIFDKLTEYGEPLSAGNGFHDSILKSVANGKLIEALKEERPQGEWLHYLGCGVGKAVCSECDQLGEIKNYCGNCGARMQKGGAE